MRRKNERRGEHRGGTTLPLPVANPSPGSLPEKPRRYAPSLRRYHTVNLSPDVYLSLRRFADKHRLNLGESVGVLLSLLESTD